MGFMDKLLGKGIPEHPALNESDPAGGEYKKSKDYVKKVIQQYQQSTDLSKKNRIDPKSWIEMVASGNNAFLLIGTPPKVFAFAWKDGNKEFDLKDYAVSTKMNQANIMRFIGGITKAYEKFASSPRYQTELDGKKIIFIDSKEMAEQLLYVTQEMQK